MMNYKTGGIVVIILVTAVLLAGCTGTPSAPADLKYHAAPGESQSYETKTVVTGQNMTETRTIDMNVVKVDRDIITRDAVIRSRAVNGTPAEATFRFETDSRGIPVNLTPQQQQIFMSQMVLPGTLVYPDHPVSPGDSWHSLPVFNGTTNMSGIPVEFRYAGNDTYTFTGNGSCTVSAGTSDCNRIRHTGTSRLTLTMIVENTTIVTTTDRTYSGEDQVAADRGYLVTSDYEEDITSIIDTSAMTGDPMGLSMTGTSSHVYSSTVLVRK